ncbi:MAG: hypothetical protein ABI581_14455 [Sediminibacterium sp.]
MNSILTETFEFESPGEEFVKLEEGTGYTCAKKQTTIKYILLPGSYEKGLKEMKDLKGFEKTNERWVIDTFTVSKEKQQFFFVLLENAAPSDSGFENMISFITYLRHTENVTLGVVAGYPKSLDKEMRQRMIKTALTLHKL